MSFSGVPPLLTVTVRVAVAVAPEASSPVSDRVCTPSATVVVFQSKLAVVPLMVVVKSWAPSRVSVNVLEVPRALVSVMPIGCVPATVAPAGGELNDATRLAGCTVIRRRGGLGSVPPALSVTTSIAS